MTTTLANPRLALWDLRKAVVRKRALLEMYRSTLCGCSRCNDSDRIEELGALIQRATEAIADLGNQICERRTSLSVLAVRFTKPL